MTGSDGGRDLNVHTLTGEGVQLVGRCVGARDGVAAFAPDLAENLTRGDAQAFELLRAIDDFVRRQGLDAPADRPPAYLRPIPELARAAPPTLDLAAAGISAMIWATGYEPDLGWIRLPILDDQGHPRQRRGVTAVPGLYLLGLDWLYTRGSGLFQGVGQDAAYLASLIAAYLAETTSLI